MLHLMQPTYDVTKSYDWNYENGPVFTGEIPAKKVTTKPVKLFDFELNSPLGIPAGPLLNSNWIKLYAELGWDILVYKTVRSIEFPAHPNPNCIFIHTDRQFEPTDAGSAITGDFVEPDSVSGLMITNSFGMPSKSPDVWMADIDKAHSYLSDGQVMVVSVVGSVGVERELIEDYAHCARLAKEAGAKIIEVNYSCPNVCTGEGAIFTDAETSRAISKVVKEAIGPTPLLIKVGNYINADFMETVISANAPYVDGIAGINTIAMKVYNDKKEQALSGEGRLVSGLCGAGIRDAGQKFTEELAEIRKKNKFDFIICGVGGMMTPEDIDQRLSAGADIVMSATAAMWEPGLTMAWKEK